MFKKLASLSVLFLGVALSPTPTLGQALRVGCSLVRQYDGAQVKMLLEQARSTVGDGEVNALHAKYIGLRNECGFNKNASRVVHISAGMRQLLDQYGVNVGRFAVSAR